MSDASRPLNPAAKVRGDDFNRLRTELISSRITGAAGVRFAAFGGGMTAAGIPQPPFIRRSISPRALTATLSVAGAVPTSAEITTALQSVSWDTVPLLGDTVELQVGGVTKLRATVCPTVTLSGLFAVSFIVSSTTYYAQIVQTGLY